MNVSLDHFLKWKPPLSSVQSFTLSRSGGGEGVSGGLGAEPRVRAAKSRTAAHPAKLDSDKFGDEAARPNRWLDGIMTSLKFPHPHPPLSRTCSRSYECGLRLKRPSSLLSVLEKKKYSSISYEKTTSMVTCKICTQLHVGLSFFI